VIIETSAPTRADLAGGTIDIPPLYLFHEGAMTVNFALSIRAHCRIETRDDDRIVIESVDQNSRLEATVADLAKLKSEPQLELLAKLVYFFRPEAGFHMTTRSDAPAGAGLAGSSTLDIATVAALNKLVGDKYEPEKFISIAAGVETQVIRVPAGYQDYYPAQFGGVAAIHFGVEGMTREGLYIDQDALERRMVVCYTGEPRNSGINNWEITKRHIDGDRKIFEIFDGIRDRAVEVRSAIVAGEWDDLGNILNIAHTDRQRLSPNITTPHMDHLIDIALANGAIAPKVCGAGGGGCIAFYCEEGRRADVEAALSNEQGARVLDWTIDPDGLKMAVA
jgi:D-glycero-alpha-D-manno-heptose-7-phosphate kinase